MRKILFFLASLTTLSTMNAQVIWSDNFDDQNISDWTQYDEDGDGQKWFTVQLAGAPSPVLRSFSWIESLGSLSPDNWIVSPAIDLPTIDSETEAIT